MTILEEIEPEPIPRFRKQNEIGISKMRNMTLTPSEISGVKPQIQPLKNHKDVDKKMLQIIRDTY